MTTFIRRKKVGAIALVLSRCPSANDPFSLGECIVNPKTSVKNAALRDDRFYEPSLRVNIDGS